MKNRLFDHFFLLDLDNIKKQDVQHIDSFDDIKLPPDHPIDYCYIERPGNTRNSFLQHGKCEFHEVSDDLDENGIWNVVSGIKGKTQEYTFQVNLQTSGLFIEVKGI